MYREDDPDSLRALADILQRERDEANAKLAAAEEEARELRAKLAAEHVDTAEALRERCETQRARHDAEQLLREADYEDAEARRAAPPTTAGEVGHGRNARRRMTGAEAMGWFFAIVLFIIVAAAAGGGPHHHRHSW